MHIENEVRYNAAIERNIRANANTTRRRKWEAMDRYQDAYDFLNQQGQFEPTEDEDGGWITHPWVKISFGKFFSAMYDQHNDWGGLSEKQHAAVVKMIDDAAQRIADREASFQAAAKASDHFGEIGQWYGNVLLLCCKIKTMFEFDQYLGFLAFLTILTIGFWLMIFLLTFVIPYWLVGAIREYLKYGRDKEKYLAEQKK